MADVCIFYSRRDRRWPLLLEAVIAPRWSVWWDDKIRGAFPPAIEEAIAAAKCAIPIWSSSSRASAIVYDEVRLAQKRGLTLLPVSIERNVDPPLGFGTLDVIDLADWTGGPDHPGIQRLIAKLHTAAPAPLPIEQRPTISIGNASTRTPLFFFSVSSHETQLQPPDAVHALSLFGAETILASAYDVSPTRVGDRRRSRRQPPPKLTRALKRAQAAGARILLDSGNYESTRKKDDSWKAVDLHEVLKSTPHDWAFCYDEFNPPAKLSSMIRAVVRAVERDSHHTSKPVLPIVHAPQTKNGGYNTENVPAAMRQIAVELKPPLIAIPERELGSGIIERAKAVNAIRRELNELGYYQPIHILGTGNPLSIAILTAVGADSFDGLEWCRVAADAATCRLHHFQQYDFFSYQTALASSAIVRDAFQSDRINYAGKVVFHNLDFFKNFIDDLRAAVTDNRATRFLSERLPKGSMEQLEQALPKAF